MHTVLHPPDPRTAYHVGRRLTALQFFDLENDGNWYELVDGVVVMSPSPTPKHQHVALRFAALIDAYTESNPVGVAYFETDVLLESRPDGRDLVYRPDVAFVRTENVRDIGERIACAPDLVIEVASPSTQRFDQETKLSDYERHGVLELWLVDMDAQTVRFLRLRKGRYVDVSPVGQVFESESVPGFKLDLRRIRAAFSHR